MRFAGRNFPSPLPPSRTATAEGVTFRFDDSERSESWGEFHLTEQDLLDALAMVRRIRAGDALAEADEVVQLSTGRPEAAAGEDTVIVREVENTPGAIEPDFGGES